MKQAPPLRGWHLSVCDLWPVSLLFLPLAAGRAGTPSKTTRKEVPPFSHWRSLTCPKRTGSDLVENFKVKDTKGDYFYFQVLRASEVGVNDC